MSSAFSPIGQAFVIAIWTGRLDKVQKRTMSRKFEIFSAGYSGREASPCIRLENPTIAQTT
jgi:hypothetical protein